MYIFYFEFLLSFGVFEPFLNSVVRHMFGQCLLRTKLRNYRGSIILGVFNSDFLDTRSSEGP